MVGSLEEFTEMLPGAFQAVENNNNNITDD